MDINYKNSGVDIDVADAAKKEIAQHLDTKASPRLLNRVGAFASLYDFTDMGVANPVLVLKTEEPGSKQKLAFENNKIENICYDMINHLTNDILVMGATPLTVQDAVICGKLEEKVVPQIVKYLSEACKFNGSILTGGETSEQPSMLKLGTYVLTSSIVGIVDKNAIIDGSKIEAGDTVLALESSGLHTNGYSFVRMLMDSDAAIADTLIEGETFMENILTPHRSYYKELIGLFANKNLVGMAHITGGGIAGNLNRILPANLDAQIDKSKIKILPIFKFLKKASAAADSEMLKTFNMGVGMTIVVKKGSEQEFINHFKSFNLNSYPIGTITANGNKTVNYINTLKY